MTSKRKLYLVGLITSACILTSAAIGVSTMLDRTPNAPAVTYLSEADNGKTIAVKEGTTVRLQLKDLGDGGYSWSIVSQGSLTLLERTHANPSGLLGDFGSDIWVFSADEAGSSMVSLTCARSWDVSDVAAQFSVTIAVQ